MKIATRQLTWDFKLHGLHGVEIQGEMETVEVNDWIRFFERSAAGMLKRTNADHILYAVKRYDGDRKEVSFYQFPMTDREYDENVANVPGVLVYALHSRKVGM